MSKIVCVFNSFLVFNHKCFFFKYVFSNKKINEIKMKLTITDNNTIVLEFRFRLTDIVFVMLSPESN